VPLARDADSGIGNKFVIYESSVRVCETGVRYATGDYMKVIRSGAQIKYYHIKASDGPLAKGTLHYSASVTKFGNNIAVINKALGRCNIGIPASTRGFFINTISVDYFVATTDNKFSVK
jgi:hypothetical protein